jgi:fatty-acyl-CoA synthase
MLAHCMRLKIWSDSMLGLMMDRPLLLASILEYAERFHGQTQIVSRESGGTLHRYGYSDAAMRCRQLAKALRTWGIQPGDRIGTLAWNSYRQFELFYGVSGIGAVCHTINPRLAVDTIQDIVNRAADRILFVDACFLPLVGAVVAATPCVQQVVVLDPIPERQPPGATVPNRLDYEAWLATENDSFDWPEFDERSAAALCFTSGTSGRPKGVLYSHRSCLLQALTLTTPAEANLSAEDCVAALVPMFHVAAWGTPFAVPLSGAKYVLPGAHLDGERLYSLLDGEGVTTAFGVPAVWQNLLQYLDEHAEGRAPRRLRRIQTGGAAPSRAFLDRFEKDLGILMINGWGMTETNSVCGIGTMTAATMSLSDDARTQQKRKTGRGLWGVELKHVAADGRTLAHDGHSAGELLVRGSWVMSGYFEDSEATATAFDAQGWFRTGDVVTIDSLGFVQIVDRIKDLIKSGGEWISSLELENVAASHPEVVEAAAIAIPHPRWDERPLMIVVMKSGHQSDEEAVRAFMAERLTKWCVPDRVTFRASPLPRTGTGKADKVALRREYGGLPPIETR